MPRLALSLALLAGVLTGVLAGSLHAQSPDRAAQRAAQQAAQLAALDRDVWRPFLQGVRSDSAPLYVGVHGRDFHWVAPGARGRIMDRAEYDADSRMVMRRRREEGATIEIDVRFLERNVTATFAAEKAVTRFVLRRPGRAPETSYGIAHHFSRLEDGVWRVLLRHGSTEPATEATFAAATPLTDEAAPPAAPTARP